MNKYICVFMLIFIFMAGCDKASQSARHEERRAYLIERRLEVLGEVDALTTLLKQCTTNNSRVLVIEQITKLVKHAEFLRASASGRGYF